MALEEIIVAFEAGRERPASELRSTLLTTSLQSLRAHGHYDAYAARVPAEHRDLLLSAVAGVWLPIEVGMAHYATCDALGLATAEQMAIGQEVNERVQGSLLGLLARTAKGAGVGPWPALANCQRYYGRLFNSGTVRLVKLGPKEARADLVGCPLLASAHFRNGLRGVTSAGMEFFCDKAYVHELPKHTTATAFTMRLSWV